MAHEEDDSLWDKGVQEFIEACKHEKLIDISLGYSVLDAKRQILKVSAQYRSRSRGLIPIGYRWADRPKLGWVAEVFVGDKTAPAGQKPDAYFRIAWRAGLWRERKQLAEALKGVTNIFFKAHRVRGGLELEHLKAIERDGDLPVPRAREVTLQTLNDLAFLYGGRSGSGLDGVRQHNSS